MAAASTLTAIGTLSSKKKALLSSKFSPTVTLYPSQKAKGVTILGLFLIMALIDAMMGSHLAP